MNRTDAARVAADWMLKMAQATDPWLADQVGIPRLTPQSSDAARRVLIEILADEGLMDRGPHLQRPGNLPGELYVDYENELIDARMKAAGLTIKTHYQFARKSGVRIKAQGDRGYRVEVKWGRGEPWTDANELRIQIEAEARK